MKAINLGRTVKKWLGQGKDIVEISSILTTLGYKYSVQDCIDAYYSLMGWMRVIPERSSQELVKAILNKEKLHIYGDTGCGKTFTIKNIASELNLDLMVSYATTNEELVADWGTEPYEEDDRLFVLEGEGFYWRSYAVIKDYILNCKSALVIITTKQDTPTKNITKMVKQFKIFTPSKTDMQTYISQFDPNWDGDIDKIYDRDQRITWRNYLYHTQNKSAPSEGIVDAKNVAYKILTGKATYSDFEKCIHPWNFVIGWISYNASNFYYDDTLKDVLNKLAFVDTYKFNYKRRYLIQILLELPTAEKKGFMTFPPYKLTPKEEDEKVETSEYVIEKYKVNKPKQKPKSSKRFKQTTLIDEEEFDDLGDFMLI